ncbi:MAG: GIY-YIG nuclease family protein [Planctomycetota bacterium]|nr:MAG: GIY-YIG nuclease family protein [Planctomycetota bacterium]
MVAKSLRRPSHGGPIFEEAVARLPPAPGSYWLNFALQRRLKLKVGALGSREFLPGWYGYAGSARGPGGLRARLGRHLLGGHRCHWHVDFLRRVEIPAGAWWCQDPAVHEHLWMEAGLRLGGSHWIPGFGASDCACPSHFLYFEAEPSFAGMRTRLRALLSEVGSVSRALKLHRIPR